MELRLVGQQRRCSATTSLPNTPRDTSRRNNFFAWRRYSNIHRIQLERGFRRNIPAKLQNVAKNIHPVSTSSQLAAIAPPFPLWVISRFLQSPFNKPRSSKNRREIDMDSYDPQIPTAGMAKSTGWQSYKEEGTKPGYIFPRHVHPHWLPVDPHGLAPERF